MAHPLCRLFQTEMFVRLARSQGLAPVRTATANASASFGTSRLRVRSICAVPSIRSGIARTRALPITVRATPFHTSRPIASPLPPPGAEAKAKAGDTKSSKFGTAGTGSGSGGGASAGMASFISSEIQSKTVHSALLGNVRVPSTPTVF